MTAIAVHDDGSGIPQELLEAAEIDGAGRWSVFRNVTLPLLGPAMVQPQWDAAIELALADPNRWVVQQLASIPVSEFPVVGPDGRGNSGGMILAMASINEPTQSPTLPPTRPPSPRMPFSSPSAMQTLPATLTMAS